MSQSSKRQPMDRRPFGRHPDQVSIIGLGGYHLGKAKTIVEAVRIVHEALDAGVNFLDNAFDANFRSFQTRVLPELARQKIAAIGMKSLGGDGRVIKKKVARVDDAMRYAMSLPVCTTVSGIDSLRVLRQNLDIARDFSPMTARERQVYEQGLADYALDGRFELYKTSAEHDGEVGRRQHGFPSQEEVPM